MEEGSLSPKVQAVELPLRWTAESALHKSGRCIPNLQMISVSRRYLGGPRGQIFPSQRRSGLTSKTFAISTSLLNYFLTLMRADLYAFV